MTTSPARAGEWLRRNAVNLSATIANGLWLASSLPALAKFRAALHRPAETQRDLLRGYLVRHAGSAYGKAHGFGSIGSYEDFSRRVPLVDYDDLEPWITRIMRGEKQVLTREPLTHLVPTSGSSGARKLIPFTAGLQREFNRAIGPWTADLCRRHPALVLGPAYWSITPAATTVDAPSSVPIGFEDDSAYLGGARKMLVDFVMAAPAALRLVTDMEAFRYVTLLCLVRQRDLRLISVWHPSFLSVLLDALPGCWGNLLEDIRHGRCRYSVPGKVQAALKLQAQPELVKQLQRADPSTPETVWPCLKVISCWGDAHAALAKADLERRFPNVHIQPKGLLATEAVVTLPYGAQHPLAIRSHFFEFLDSEDRIHLAHELKDHETYEVIITTAGGLWRYRLGDQVRVTGFAGRTPSLCFLGRAGNVSDRCGEKISEAFAAEAIRHATAILSAPPRFALLAPETNGVGCHYTIYLEAAATPEVATRLETYLRKNPNYAWARDLGQLQPARVFSIARGGYECFVVRELTRGKRWGEIKPCPLSLHDDWGRYFEGGYQLPQVPVRTKTLTLER